MHLRGKDANVLGLWQMHWLCSCDIHHKSIIRGSTCKERIELRLPLSRHPRVLGQPASRAIIESR